MYTYKYICDIYDIYVIYIYIELLADRYLGILLGFC